LLTGMAGIFLHSGTAPKQQPHAAPSYGGVLILEPILRLLNLQLQRFGRLERYFKAEENDWFPKRTRLLVAL
jgi:hypothetical protein